MLVLEQLLEVTSMLGSLTSIVGVIREAAALQL